MNLLSRHAGSKLSAYAEGQLPARHTRRIGKHLSECVRCSAELDEINFAIRIAKNLPLTHAPDSLWPAVHDARPHAKPVRYWKPAAAIALLLALSAAPVWYFGYRQQLHSRYADRAPTALERIAIEQHVRSIQGSYAWELRTSDVRKLKTWVHAKTGLSASIPDRRTAEDLRLTGASLIRVGANTAAEIGYVVNAQPVTLLTARLSDLSDPPREGRMSKDVAYRYDRDHGFKILTWGSSGQAYVMVSTLPGFGQQGCFLCHTQEARRDLIRRMSPQTAASP